MIVCKSRFGLLAVSAIAWAFASSTHAQAVSDPALRGAIDIHSHVDPDGYGPGHNGRAYDSLELARLAQEAGMRGFVIKMHYDQSADDAYLVRKLHPSLEVFGGIGTNFATGGMNPAAIRQMADVKGGWGRIVWMPTWDAKHYVEHHGNDPGKGRRHRECLGRDHEARASGNVLRGEPSQTPGAEGDGRDPCRQRLH
jgi:hypothetical protein